MAHIQKRTRDGQTSWRARHVDPDGTERCRTFKKRSDAERFLTSIEHDKLIGAYVDPDAGRLTFGEHLESWLGVQVWRASTDDQVRSLLGNHVLPFFGDRELAKIAPSHVQAWIKHRSEHLAPTTLGVVHGYLSTVMRAAVVDRLIIHNPCDGSKLPRKMPTEITPPTTDQVEALIGAVPDQYRALVVTLAGAGLRLSEGLGLTVDRVDFLRRTIRVDRQLVAVKGEGLQLGPPKTEASVRSVPAADVVLEALAHHLEHHEVSEDLGLMFTTAKGGPIRRSRFSDDVWRPAVAEAGLPAGTRTHDLRHYFASLLIAHGASVKAVQSALGHASARETLDTYAHLWPTDEDYLRSAIDGVLGASCDGPQTDQTSRTRL